MARQEIKSKPRDTNIPRDYNKNTPLLVVQCWRAKVLEDSPSRYNKLVVPPVRHSSSTPHAPPVRRRIPEYERRLSFLCPEKLEVDGLNKVVIATSVCSMRSSRLQCFRATCLCVVQFLLIPWIIPYRTGYWANDRSAIEQWYGRVVLGTFFQWLGVTRASDPPVPCVRTGFSAG